MCVVIFYTPPVSNHTKLEVAPDESWSASERAPESSLAQLTVATSIHYYSPNQTAITPFYAHKLTGSNDDKIDAIVGIQAGWGKGEQARSIVLHVCAARSIFSKIACWCCCSYCGVKKQLVCVDSHQLGRASYFTPCKPSSSITSELSVFTITVCLSHTVMVKLCKFPVS